MREVTYQQLTEGLKQSPLQFLKSCALKGSVRIHPADPDQIPARNLVALAILLVGNWKVSFETDREVASFTWLPHIFILPYLLLVEKILTPTIKSKHLKTVRELRAHPDAPRKLGNDGKKLLYLRTDLLGQNREGGSFTHVAGFIHGAKQLGWTVDLVATGLLPGEPNHLSVIPYAALGSFDPDIAEIEYSFRVFNRLKSSPKPDCIYQRHSGYNLAGLMLAKHWNIPFILEVNNLEVWIRDNWGTQKSNTLLEETEKTLFEGADAIIVVSQVLKDDMVKFGAPADKVLVNPNGVEEDIFRPDVPGQPEVREKYGIGKKDILVGFIGSFGVWHGVPILAKAIPEVRKKDPTIKFLLIGDGELRKDIEKELSPFVKDGSVIFAGRVPHHDAPAHLAACDILASPHVPNADGTRFFGSPTKLFEYMAMERAIVASDLEQIGEILEDGKDSVLVPPSDHHALAKAIIDLAGNPEKRKKLAKASHDKALAKYTWRNNAENSFNHLPK